MRRLLGAAVLAGVVVLGLTLVGVIPVRAYVEQRNEIIAAEARIAALDADNAALRERARRLRTTEEIERLAREQFMRVRPGDVVYAIPGLRTSTADSPGIGLSDAPPPPPAPRKGLFARLVDRITFWS
jgi:cell division protein FtsB